jgi:hypothetical protein
MASIGVSCTDAYTPRDSQNLRVFSIWTMAAAVSFATATILIGERIIDRGVLAWSLAGLTLLLSLLAIRSYLIFLRAADELLRRIQLEGLALGFGAGAVFMMSYRLFERLGAPKLDSNDPFIIMAVFWALGQYIGMRRYSGGEGR